MEGPNRRVIRFGTFEADSVTGELRKGGRRVNLQDQPFRLLMLLLERPGEVVARTELREKLWGETYVDFEEGLNTAVRKLRWAQRWARSAWDGRNKLLLETGIRTEAARLADGTVKIEISSV